MDVNQTLSGVVALRQSLNPERAKTLENMVQGFSCMVVQEFGSEIVDALLKDLPTDGEA